MLEEEFKKLRMQIEQEKQAIEEEKKKRFIFTKVKDIDDGEKEFAKMLFNGLFEDGDVVYA